MKKIIYGKITHFEEKKSGSFKERTYYGTSIINIHELNQNLKTFKLRTTSVFPVDGLGSSFNNNPPVGSYFIGVMDTEDYDKVCYILTYFRPEIEGTHSGIPAQYVPNNGFNLSLGSLKPMSLIHGPGEFIVRGNEFSELNLNTVSEKLEIKTKEYSKSFLGGFTKDIFFEQDSLHSHIEVYTKQASKKTLSKDTNYFHNSENLEIESPNNNNYNYDDKVIIKAGAIFNLNLKNQDPLNHIYQLETRQAVFQDKFKDCVTVLRLGYQKENNKYTNSTTYPEGTIIEWYGKINNIEEKNYSTMLFRWGELLDNTKGDESEKTKGEFFRLQLYNNVKDLIGSKADKDYLGEGLGYKYLLNNERAEQQFTLSIGKTELEENSFLRMHTHNFIIQDNKINGVAFTHIFDNNTFYFKNEIINFKDNEKDVIFEQNFKKENTGTFIIKKSKKDENSEKIEISKDLLEIEIKIDDQKSYLLKFNSGKIILQLNGKRSIEINENGEIKLNPGNEKKQKSIKLGINGFGHNLVTKEWVLNVFNNHVHPTTGPGSPTLPPQPALQPVSAPTQSSHLTYLTIAE